MKIAKDIKKHIDTISGKRRITILNKYIKETYKSPTTDLRNIEGEYSAKRITEELSLLSTYIKNLCANNGKALGRYYSYTTIQEMEGILAALAAQFDGVDSSTAKTTLKSLLQSSASTLERIKPVLGPFIEARFDKAVENLASDLASHHDDLQKITDTAKEVGKQANAVQKHFEKSEEASGKFENLVKEVKTLQDELVQQKNTTKEIQDRNRTVSKYVDKLQNDFEKKVDQLYTMESDMEKMRERIEEEYRSAIAQAREFEVAAARMEQIQTQTKNILNQARHALNVSQGAGFLESYRELYERSARVREYLPWAIGAAVGFLLSVFTISINVLNIRALPDVTEIFRYPALLAQISLVPLALFSFFFSVLQLRKKKQIKQRYHSRFAALETYLKLSEHLPYDSPEQLRTASHIMRYLEEDFNPIAVKAMFNANNNFNNAVTVR